VKAAKKNKVKGERRRVKAAKENKVKGESSVREKATGNPQRINAHNPERSPGPGNKYYMRWSEFDESVTLENI